MRAWLGAWVFFHILGCAGASRPSTSPEGRPADTVQVASFEQVWARVRDSYPDPALGGVDWERVREELGPRASQARTADELRPVLQAMLGRLGDSHLAVWSPTPTEPRAAATPPPPPQLPTKDQSRPPGTPAQIGHVRTTVRFEARRLAGGTVAYVFFDRFMLPVPDQFRSVIIEAVSDHCGGLIIDLRGNSGGLGLMVRGLAGHLMTDRALSLGTLVDRSSRLELRPNPRLAPERFDGLVAILVDERSASTAEIFAAGLQHLGRAQIFGRETAGKVASSIVERLPNGDLLQLVVADYLDPAGVRVEGRGVLPDVVIENREASDCDPVVEAALSWMLGDRYAARSC